MQNTFIIGAGFTGVGVGLTSSFKIFEASEKPGGIYATYQKSFCFEIGGGHWILGGDKFIMESLWQNG
jgi:protoporphyrinogen oxidase